MRCDTLRSTADRTHTSQSPNWNSIRTSQPSCEQHDGRGIEECGSRGDGSLEVLCQRMIAPEPCEEALDHPAMWSTTKPIWPGCCVKNLDNDPGGIGHPIGGIGAVRRRPVRCGGGGRQFSAAGRISFVPTAASP